MAESDNDWQQLAYTEQILSIARFQGDKQAEGDAEVQIGKICIVLGLTAEAVKSFEQAIPIYREFHNQIEIGYVLLQLGSSLCRIECFRRAFTVLEEAVLIAKHNSFGQLLLDCLCQLGLASIEEGHLRKAIMYHQEALVMIRMNNNKEAEMRVLDNLGGAYAKLGSSYEAISCHELALFIAYELGNVESQALALGNIGCAYTDAFGWAEGGICYFEQALILFSSIRDQYNEAKTLANIGNAYWRMKRFQLALSFLGQAQRIAAEQGDRGLLGGILSKLGNTYSALGQHDKAFHAHQRALLLDQGRGDRQAEEHHLNDLGLLQKAAGHLDEALQLHRKALVLARARKDLLEEARQLGNIAGALTLLGQVEEGLLHNKHALKIFQELGDTRGEGHAYVNIGMAYISTRIISADSGQVYAIRGNKGKALAYWRMGQLMLKIASRAENDEVQQKIDGLKGVVQEKTFQRWWRISENHIRWLIFQHFWIDKTMFVISHRNDDLLFYSRDVDRDDFFTFNSRRSERVWQQADSNLKEENWREALVYYQEALAIECKHGQPGTQALLLGNLGCSYAKVGKFEEGMTYLRQSLELFRFLNDTSNIIKTLLNLGTLQLQVSQLQISLITEARAYFDMALNLTDMYDNRLLDSVALRKMSEVYRFCNKIYVAKSFLNYALEVANIHGDKQEEGKLLTNAGFICMELGQTYKAISYFQRARDLYQTLHDSKSEGEQWCSLAITYAVQGKFDIAQENFLQAQKIFHYDRNLLNESQIHVYIGVLHAFKGHLPCFLAYLRRAFDLVKCNKYAQEQIQHMQEQVEKATEREAYRQAWSKSTQYYQALC